MNRSKKICNFIAMNVVLALMPIGDVFYLIPSKITSGGLYGLAIVIMHGLGYQHASERAVSVIAFTLTSPLLVYAYFKFSKEYFRKTFYATVALPIYMFTMGLFLQYINFNIIESSIVTATILGSIIQGVGIAILMGLGGSTGGTDIIAKMINSYFPAISLGLGVTITNLIIIGVSSIMFGLDRGIAAVISIVLTGWSIDLTLWALFKNKEINNKGVDNE